MQFFFGYPAKNCYYAFNNNANIFFGTSFININLSSKICSLNKKLIKKHY